MPHIDKFGREWKFEPAHNTDRMIKVATPVMERFILADRLIKGPTELKPYFQGREVECYVLRLEGSRMGLCTGARWSDEGAHYHSDLLHNLWMVDELVRFMYREGDIKNHAAILEVYKDRMGEIW
jgi:hypothetical protein